jgi:hypothetical protein
MASKGQVVRIGPFVGGINKKSNPGVIGDQELVDLINMEVDIDGTLIARPGIQARHYNDTDFNLKLFAQEVDLTGFGIITGAQYMFWHADTKLLAQTIDNDTIIDLGAPSTVSKCSFTYSNKQWFPATFGSANGGGNWTGSWTAVAAMPRAEFGVIFRDRLFLCAADNNSTNYSRVHFSDPGNFTSWPGTNFFDVNPGDGQKLTGIAVYQDSLIIFKTDSTYVMAFDTSPSDGVLKPINTIIGATKTDGNHNNGHLVCSYENSLFVLHRGAVYEMINYTFTKVNEKVPLVRSSPLSSPLAPFNIYEECISIVGDRVYVRYGENAYVYNLRTRTWSIWNADKTLVTDTNGLSATGFVVDVGDWLNWPAYWVLDPTSDDPLNKIPVNFKVFYAGPCVQFGWRVFTLQNFYGTNANPDFADTREWCNTNTSQGGIYDKNFRDIECKLVTKRYDFGMSYSEKKLIWWGAELTTDRGADSFLNLLTTGNGWTWDELEANIANWDALDTYIWNQLGAWDAVAIADTDDTIITGDFKMYVKFLEATPFNWIQFQIQLVYNGLANEGQRVPKIYLIYANIGQGQQAWQRQS